MKLPVVARSEVELARVERDEWRRRAESSLSEQPPAPAIVQSRRRRRLPRPLLAAGTLVSGVALAALTVSGPPDATAGPDYPDCIGQARYEQPIEGNQYQELVNALYACGVYELP